MNLFKNDKEGLFKNIFTAYSILLVHLLLLAGAGVAVVLFKGVYHYLPWIMILLGLAAISAAYIFYRRLSRKSSDIGSFLSMPGLEDRTIEVKLIGGLASFRISPKENGQVRLDQKPAITPDNLLIETAPDDMTEQKILKLTALFEKDLITKEEFEKAKQKILQG
ncbi:MAG: hypothetical protein A3J80_02870 [Desulfobacula sp. RIFOXYB2_FULL_45_6]|nr:MAG: hypothetical protein A3J80_02870 [Desulfobacula sp. RIFOXYB2_FULL_45_6]